MFDDGRVAGLRQARADAGDGVDRLRARRASARGARAAGADEPDLADVYTAAGADGRLAGYEATERFYEIGTPAALLEAEAICARIP